MSNLNVNKASGPDQGKQVKDTDNEYDENMDEEV